MVKTWNSILGTYAHVILSDNKHKLESRAKNRGLDIQIVFILAHGLEAFDAIRRYEEKNPEINIKEIYMLDELDVADGVLKMFEK